MTGRRRLPEPPRGRDLGGGLGHAVGDMERPAEPQGPARQRCAQCLAAHQEHPEGWRRGQAQVDETGQQGRHQRDMSDAVALQVVRQDPGVEALAQQQGGAGDRAAVGDCQPADVAQRQAAQPGVAGAQTEPAVDQGGGVQQVPAGEHDGAGRPAAAAGLDHQGQRRRPGVAARLIRRPPPPGRDQPTLPLPLPDPFGAGQGEQRRRPVLPRRRTGRRRTQGQ